MSETCTSCGAALKESADRCDLCGTPVGSNEGEPIGDSADRHEAAEESPDVEAASKRADVVGVFCNDCGWKNPPHARYCSKCGSRLQSLQPPNSGSSASDLTSGSSASHSPPRHVSKTSPPDEDDRDSGIGRQIAIVVGMGLLFVMALYMITVLSQDSQQASSGQSTTPAPVVDEGPLAAQFVPREEELKKELEAAQGQQAVEVRRRLLDLYLAANRLDLAGSEAERIAEMTGEETDWALAGNLYYDVMESRQPPERAAYAKKAISAYRQVLEINPENLDVRTDMAIAYMYDPDNPMLAIQETNRVLEQDSLHVQANFNRGVMLANINRIDQAVQQFQKVKRIVGDPENPVYQRAEQAIESVQGLQQ